MKQLNVVWIIGLLLWCNQAVWAQPKARIVLKDKQHSATSINLEEQNFLKGFLKELEEYDADRIQGLIEVPVKVHIVQDGNGLGHVDIHQLQTAFEQLDRYFLPAYIRFVPLGDYNYINKAAYYDLDKKTEESLLCSSNDVPHVINLYLVGTISEGATQYCGYTYYPKDLDRNIDRIILSQDCLMDGVSLARQMGHYFSLFPTAGLGLDDIATQEFVDGSNCATAGDEICDTPADPGLKLADVDERCGYIGRQQDLSGRKRFYKPNTRNIMSDNPRLYCCNHFTPEQYKRIRYALIYLRSYLTFPKRRYSKRQLKTLAADKGLEGEVAVYMNQQPLTTTRSNGIHIANNEPFASGTQYNLAIVNNAKCYIYVLEGDAKRGIYLQYPKKGDKQFFKGEEETAFIIPANEERLEIDEQKGEKGINHIIVLFSKKQLRINQLIDEMNSIEEPLDAVQRLYSILGAKLIPNTYLNYAEEGVKVNGIATDQNIMPVVVEYRQQ